MGSVRFGNAASVHHYDTSKTLNAVCVGSKRITPDDHTEEVRHISFEVQTMDTCNVGEQIGIIVPGPHAFGNKEHMRLYSIAGSEQKNGQSCISICVKRCFYLDEISGEKYKGIASNYLCDLQPGTSVVMTGPYKSAFKFPDDNSSNILMIGLGTGIAPFRSFVRHIYDDLGGWEGQVRLFYGAKTGLDLLYMNDENKDLADYFDKKTFEAFKAVSKRPYLNEPEGVEDALVNNKAEVWRLLCKKNTYLYVAGEERIKEMMEKALSQVAGSIDDWLKKKAELEEEQRIFEILY